MKQKNKVKRLDARRRGHAALAANPMPQGCKMPLRLETGGYKRPGSNNK